MLTASLLAATTLVVGQTDGPSEHLKILQPLVGQWVHVGPTQSDSPSLGPKGTEFIAVMTFTWAIDRNALQIRWSGKSGEKKPIEFIELVGWDRKQKKLVSHGFANTGSVEHNIWTRDGDIIICHTTGVNEEGKELSLKYLNEIHGDVLTFKEVEITVAGEKKPANVFKYRRVR